MSAPCVPPKKVVRVVVSAVAARAHDDAGERARYRLPACVEALASASRASGDDAILARVDLLLGEDGEWRACEINADCPGGATEARSASHASPAPAAGFREARRSHARDRRPRRSPARARAGARHRPDARHRLRRGLADLRAPPAPPRGSLAALRALLVPPTSPRASAAATLLVARGEPLGVLYRYFPAEYMEWTVECGRRGRRRSARERCDRSRASRTSTRSRSSPSRGPGRRRIAPRSTRRLARVARGARAGEPRRGERAALRVAGGGAGRLGDQARPRPGRGRGLRRELDRRRGVGGSRRRRCSRFAARDRAGSPNASSLNALSRPRGAIGTSPSARTSSTVASRATSLVSPPRAT